jgi:hypothetical protein
LKFDKQVLFIFYKTMKRSREHTRDYSTEWIELLVILIILTILAVAMYFSFRYDPNHTITETSKNKAVIDEKGPIKLTSHPIKASIQASKQVSYQSSQKAIHMVPIEIQTGTYVVKLTAVRDNKVDLTRVRIPRSIRLVPETK